MPSRDIEFSEEWVGEAECDIDPGEPEVMYYSNGDPGHPGIPPSVEVYAVWINLKDYDGNDVKVNVLPFLHEAGIVDRDEINETLEAQEFHER